MEVVVNKNKELDQKAMVQQQDLSRMKEHHQEEVRVVARTREASAKKASEEGIKALKKDHSSELERVQSAAYSEVQKLKEKNAELLFAMESQEEKLNRIQRGYEVVYCLLPKLRLSEMTIERTKRLCPDVTFSPNDFIQHPSDEVLAAARLEDLQPFKFGLLRLSFRAQFGETAEFRSGLNVPDFQAEINQLNLDEKISSIEFRRQEYDIIHFHFQFVFRSREEKVLGIIENWTEEEVQRWVDEGQKLQEEAADKIYIADNEFIVGVRIGVDMFGGLANIEFLKACIA